MSDNSIFEQIGKQMPYRVPDGSFKDMEHNVMARVLNEKPGNRTVRPKSFSLLRLARYSAAVAASVVVLLAIHMKFFYTSSATDYADVESAFAQLSSSDQNALFELYQDDIFLEENNP